MSDAANVSISLQAGDGRKCLGSNSGILSPPSPPSSCHAFSTFSFSSSPPLLPLHLSSSSSSSSIFLFMLDKGTHNLPTLTEFLLSTMQA